VVHRVINSGERRCFFGADTGYFPDFA